MALRMINGQQAPELGIAEYVWIDGVCDFHSKTRVIPVFHGSDGPEPRIEHWTATVGKERISLSPCQYIPNPYLPQPAYLVLCEVYDAQGHPHRNNKRANLREVVHREGGRRLAEWGFRQEYHGAGLQDWKAAQDHFLRCLDAGISIHSARICDEVRYWNFKIGRQPDIEHALGQNYTLEMCDHFVLARFLLERASREFNGSLELEGEGIVYFSTVEMREDKSILHEVADRLRSCIPPDEWNPTIRIRDGFLEAGGLKPTYDPYAAAALLLGPLLKEHP